MKKLLLFIALLHISRHSFAQDVSLFTTEIDSVEKLLHSLSDNDTIKVKKLNDLARIFFYDLQYKRGAVAARQAQELALKLNYPKGEGMYLRTMSCTFMYTYYDAKARLFYKKLNEPEPVNTIKDKEAEKSYFEKGIARLYNDLLFFEKEKDKEMTGNICYAISTVSDYLEKPGDAISYFDKAIIAFKDVNMRDAVAILLIQKMNTLQKNGKTDQTERIENEVNAIIGALDDKRLSTFLCYQMCEYYTLAGKKVAAIEKALKANNDLEINEDKQLQILILENLGVNFAFVSMSDKAVEYYKKALLLREELNYYDGAIRIYFNLGFEFVTLKNFEEANKYFSRAKALAENSGDSNMIATATFRYLDGSGQILMGENKYEEALELFYQANDFFKKLNSQTHLYINFYIARCYQKTSNLKKSILYGEESYLAATSYYDQRLLIKICLLLSEVYEQSNEPGKSYEYLKKYKNFIKEKEEQDIGNRAANFEIQAIIEKNQLVKNRFEKDKLQKEKENQNQRWWLISIGGALLSTVIVLYVMFRNNKQKQKANILLQQQKEKVETTLAELEATQVQLIQLEKMASLERLKQAVTGERLRISRELHDEVGATLSGIAMYSHLTKEQLKNTQTTEVEKSLNIMQQSSGEMVNKLNDIVWLINPDQDSLQKLIQRLEEYARDMAAIKNMQVKVNVPEHLHEHSLLVESRRNIYLFCKEAINNAVKYSNGTLLELNIKEVNNKLEFSVSDNGKGFDAVMVRRGNGLDNMQKRADDIGARLMLQSKQNEGCLVSMQLKIT